MTYANVPIPLLAFGIVENSFNLPYLHSFLRNQVQTSYVNGPIVEEEDEIDNGGGNAGLRSQLERERARFFFNDGS